MLPAFTHRQLFGKENDCGEYLMNRLIADFLAKEDGAVTVDWVVLTAVLIGLCLAVFAAVSDGTEDLTADMDGQLSSQMISTTF